jgi:cobalt/nickel transport system permease protein
MHAGNHAALFAVHISDGVLALSWLAGGFVLAGLAVLFALWRLRDEEIPRIAFLTAAFFVASSIHIKVGPTSWHLLLNGLVGVLLGRRAGLAIVLGLALQYFLLMHGGFATLGVNTCIMLLPALLAAALFQSLRSARWLARPWFRAALIGTSSLVWTLSVVYSVTLLISNSLRTVRLPDLEPANAATFNPLTMTLAVLLAAGIGWFAHRRRLGPDFALGLVIGELSVLATIALNCIVLLFGGEANWTLTALVLLVVHLPIAALEGIILGFLVSFLARVQPGLLGWRATLVQSAEESAGRTTHAVPLAAAVCAGPVANGQPSERTCAAGEASGVAGQQGTDHRVLSRE